VCVGHCCVGNEKKLGKFVCLRLCFNNKSIDAYFNACLPCVNVSLDRLSILRLSL
jgi:hypothetical protein